MDDETRQKLLESATQGDENAVEELLRRYLPGLRAFIRLRSGPLIRARESADDLAQSVCREVLQHIDRFQHGNETGFKHWLFTTAMRRIQNKHEYWKAEKRDAARDVPLDGGKSGGGNEALLTCYRSLSSPSQHAMANEELARIEKAFDGLTEEEREVIALARIVGLSHKEIGEKMGTTEGAARVRLHRALIKLAEVLDEE